MRVGIEFTLAEGFEHSAGIGLGPWENYPDRASSVLLGAAASARYCSTDHAAE